MLVTACGQGGQDSLSGDTTSATTGGDTTGADTGGGGSGGGTGSGGTGGSGTGGGGTGGGDTGGGGTGGGDTGGGGTGGGSGDGTPINPPTGPGMPVGIPAIGDWYNATPMPVNSITSGTASAPTLYSLAGMPEIVGSLNVSCSYCIVDGAKVNGSVRLSGDHIVFRNSEVYGHMPSGNGTVVMASGNNIVIRGNHIHNNGNMDLTVEHDVHGVSAGNGTKYVWILENVMHHNSGDSVQVGHGHTPGATEGIYVGRNVMYADKENAVDFKIVSNTVVSENVMSNYAGGDAGGGGGVAIVLHYCHANAQVLSNTVSNSKVGVSVASLLSTCTTRPIETRVIGNTFDTLGNTGVQAWDTQIIHVEKNTFNYVPVGIDLTNCASGSTVIENQFYNVATQTAYEGSSCKPITSY
jgi:nitrous oxidase accessory protein NosD